MLKVTVSDPTTSELRLISKSSTINAGVDSGGNNKMSMANRSKTAKSKNMLQPKEPGTGFFTPGAKLAFAKLRQAFMKTLILYHFNLEYHIEIKTDELGYTIDEALG